MKRERINRTMQVGALSLSMMLFLGACSSGASSDNQMEGGASSSAPASASASEDMQHHDSEMIKPESSGDPFADAKKAADHMPQTAQTLATGIAKSAGIKGMVDSPAAKLHADLGANLQEHVYLAGMAVATAYQTGADSDEFKAATAAVDKNAVELSEMAGTIDPEMADPVLKVWRQHIGYFVDYAMAAKAKDQAGMDKAQKDLTEYTKTAGEALAKLSDGQLKAAEVTQGLQHHVDSLSAAIDALAAGGPKATGKLREAASHGGDFITMLSRGLAEGADLEGSVDDPAATLRANLTMNLQEHVYLASLAVFNAYTQPEGTKSEAFTSAAETLDHNTTQLAEMIGSVGGKEKQEEFLDLWREHIGYFVDYAQAVAGDDQEAAEAALMDLDGYRAKAGAFFEELTDGELPADDVATGLGHHVSTLAGAIDSLRAALVK